MEDTGAKPSTGKGKLLIAVALVIIVIVAIAAALILANPGGKSSSGPATLQESCVTAADLPAGWEVSSPYYVGYQGTNPANLSSAGGIGFMRNSTAQELIILNLWRFNSSADAASTFNGSKNAISMSSPGMSNLSIGDAAFIFDRDMFGFGQGRQVFACQGADLIIVQYYVSSGEPQDGVVTALANAQVHKLA
jgi:hypothetical protein